MSHGILKKTTATHSTEEWLKPYLFQNIEGLNFVQEPISFKAVSRSFYQYCHSRKLQGNSFKGGTGANRGISYLQAAEFTVEYQYVASGVL